MVLRPSELSTTSAMPSRTTAIDEDVVPRSMPTAAPTGSCCSLAASAAARSAESRTLVEEARAAAGCQRPARGGLRKEAKVMSATQLPSIRFVAFAWRTRASLGSLGRTLAACSPMRAVTLHSSQFTVLSLWRQRSDAQPREPSVQSRHRACTDDITCNVETRKSNRMSRMCLCRMCASKSSSFLAFKSAIYINRFLSLF